MKPNCCQFLKWRSFIKILVIYRKTSPEQTSDNFTLWTGDSWPCILKTSRENAYWCGRYPFVRWNCITSFNGGLSYLIIALRLRSMMWTSLYSSTKRRFWKEADLYGNLQAKKNKLYSPFFKIRILIFIFKFKKKVLFMTKNYTPPPSECYVPGITMSQIFKF